MNLNEQISRIHEMMGINESEVPNNMRRRIAQMEQIVNVVLDSSYPTDYDSEKEYFQAMMENLGYYLFENQPNVETAVQMIQFIKEYFGDEIKNYYNERVGNVQEEHQRIQENTSNKFINAIDKYGLYRFFKSTKMSPEDLFNAISEEYLTSKYKINFIKDFIKDKGDITVSEYSSPIIYKETKEAIYEIVYLAENGVHIDIVDKSDSDLIGEITKRYVNLDDSGLDKIFNFCLEHINHGD